MINQLVVVESFIEKIKDDYVFGESEPVWILTLFNVIYITKLWCYDSRISAIGISWISKGKVRTINLTTILHFMICLAVFFGAIIISGYLGS